MKLRCVQCSDDIPIAPPVPDIPVSLPVFDLVAIRRHKSRDAQSPESHRRLRLPDNVDNSEKAEVLEGKFVLSLRWCFYLVRDSDLSVNSTITNFELYGVHISCLLCGQNLGLKRYSVQLTDTLGLCILIHMGL